MKGHLDFAQYGEKREIFNFYFSQNLAKKLPYTGSLWNDFLTKWLPLPSFNQATDLGLLTPKVLCSQWKPQFWSLFYLTLPYQHLYLSNHIPKYECDLFFKTYFEFWEIQLFLKTGWGAPDLRCQPSKDKYSLVKRKRRVDYIDVFIFLLRRLFWPSREECRKCMCTPPSFLWERGERGREETALFLSLLLKQAVPFSSLSLKKLMTSNKVHRLTQK